MTPAHAGARFLWVRGNGALPLLQSYSDLVVRLEPVIMEMERQTNIVVIGHQVRGAPPPRAPLTHPHMQAARARFGGCTG